MLHFEGVHVLLNQCNDYLEFCSACWTSRQSVFCSKCCYFGVIWNL